MKHDLNCREKVVTLKGQLLYDEPLAPYTSWHVGGPARRLYIPHDLQDLQEFLAEIPPAESLIWLGLGSNTLIRDGGIQGTVVITQGGLSTLSWVDDIRIRAEAGVTSAKLARFATQRGMGGSAFLAGIPGTVGGALKMNAGAFGSETWQWVKAVDTIDRSGKIVCRSATEFTPSYRSLEGLKEDEWVVAGYFEFTRGASEAETQQIKSLLKKRNESQPIGLFSGGSTFRNPEGDYAGRLIEVCGLKGWRQGGARVSEKHANFILNEGSATAADIESLIWHIRQYVLNETGIELTPEVCILGEKPL